VTACAGGRKYLVPRPGLRGERRGEGEEQDNAEFETGGGRH
jgi:hypothetical protein